MDAIHAPFGNDYADTRAPQSLDQERTEVTKQVDHLVRLATDPRVQAEYVERLLARRAPTAAVALENVPRAGRPVYVAAGSVLTGGRPADDLLDTFGLVVADSSHRTGACRLESAPFATSAFSARSAESAERISTPELAGQLRDQGVDAGVNHIVPLGVVMKAEGGPEPTTLRRPFPAVPVPVTGRPPRVAVIDTGVSIEQRSDAYLDHLVQPDNIDPLDAFPPPGNGLLDASAGHGTFVAGVIQQVAPSARLRIYKVTDSDGICTDAQVGAAIRRAAADGADIINLSLGTSTVDGNPPPSMLAAITEVVGDHPEILIVAAAGNDGPDGDPVWPAALSPTGPGPTFPNVVAVGGLAPDGGANPWSGRGDWVTCSAVGEGVASTYVIGTEDGPLIGDPDPDTYGPDSWAVWTGTSFATPQITGGVARLCHEKHLTPLAALGALLESAPTDLAGFGNRVMILPGT